MSEQERKQVVDQMGASVGQILAAFKARNPVQAAVSLAGLMSGAGLLAQELLELTAEIKLAS